MSPNPFLKATLHPVCVPVTQLNLNNMSPAIQPGVTGSVSTVQYGSKGSLLANQPDLADLLNIAQPDDMLPTDKSQSSSLLPTADLQTSPCCLPMGFSLRRCCSSAVLCQACLVTCCLMPSLMVLFLMPSLVAPCPLPSLPLMPTAQFASHTFLPAAQIAADAFLHTSDAPMLAIQSASDGFVLIAKLVFVPGFGSHQLLGVILLHLHVCCKLGMGYLIGQRFLLLPLLSPSCSHLFLFCQGLIVQIPILEVRAAFLSSAPEIAVFLERAEFYLNLALTY